MNEWDDSLLTERATWGPTRFGGTIGNQRDEAKMRADRERYGRVLDGLNALQQIRNDDLVAGRPVDDGLLLSERIAFVSGLLSDTDRLLRGIELEREEAETRAYHAKRADDGRQALGIIETPEAARTVYDVRDEQHEAEQARLAAQPKLTKAQLDALDPNGPQAKAIRKRYEDDRDPRVQAARGNPVPDAAAWEAGLVDRHVPAPAPEPAAQPERRSLLAEIRRRVSR